MLKENQVIEISWHSQSRQHYIDRGYHFTKYKDKFLVKAEDLSRGSTAIVKVICDYCKNEYDVAWHHYVDVKNKNQKDACYRCRHFKMYENNLLERQTNLYNKALETCNQKGYVLISKKEEIKNNTTYIKFICPLHGEHEMRINNLMSGKGCPSCAHQKRNEEYKLSIVEVEKRINQFGGVLKNKECYVNNSIKNLEILCPECKNEIIITSLKHFIQHNGQVCNCCLIKGSKGERKIKSYLESNDIVYEQEKWFDDCRDINPLPFDFYLPDYKIAIEFDGEQHYKDGHFKHSKLNYVQLHDTIKNNYCKSNNIKLIRIPYWDFDDIESILHREIISHEDIV